MISKAMLNHMSKEVHELACEKGWHPDGESKGLIIERLCNNLHNEVSELHEAYKDDDLDRVSHKTGLTALESELADIIIRALDGAARLGVDIGRAVKVKHEYNKTRPWRHGGKKS